MPTPVINEVKCSICGKEEWSYGKLFHCTKTDTINKICDNCQKIWEELIAETMEEIRL